MGQSFGESEPGTWHAYLSYTREALAIAVDTSIPGRRVANVLDRVIAGRGSRRERLLATGPALTGKALDECAYERGVELRFIEPGKPV